MSEIEDLEGKIRFYEDLIPPVYPDKFPEGFTLNPTGWALTPEVVNRPDIQAQFEGSVKTIRPIGTMDVEFIDNRVIAAAKRGEIDLTEYYPCGMPCSGCFSEAAIVRDPTLLLTWQEMFEKAIDPARKIGLTSVKFLGWGELLQNRDLFDILDACEERGLEVSVFTRAQELGSDHLTEMHYGHLGITTARELVQRLSQYSTLRILFGFHSFDEKRQNKIVKSTKDRTRDYSKNGLIFVDKGVSDYIGKRNRALQYLVEAGFNDPAKGQRLTLTATPTGLDQIDEMPDIYAWAARRNMPFIIAPTMESGEKAQGLMVRDTRVDPEHEKFIALYTAVYQRALKEGILSKEQIKEAGISAYAATAACNQVANGLFVRINGLVKMCPGISEENSTYGNVHNQSIATLWATSPNYELGRKMNNWCTAKTNGMPVSSQEEIHRRLDL
ncbi:MAG: hypothetical protein DHS20C02_12680 [Micavibrio sp.]|nr:MAG: hypothetical protein DHS20C02_12680 [Micavibrio sp.]